jgi:hypothetical protein
VIRVPRREGRRPLVAALLAVVAIVASIFFDVLFRGRVLFERDLMALFWGQCASFTRVVRAGAWPLWNPYQGFGQPLLANPGAQVLYPVTWLNLLLSPEDYYTLYAAGHLLLAGAGMLWLARTLRLPWGASTAAAAVWMLSGPLLSAVDLWQHFAGAAWMPWVVAGAARALDRPSAGRTLTWALIQSLQVLTGSLDLVVLTTLPQVGLLVTRLSWRRPLDARNRHLLAVGATAAALTVAWTTALWMPALDLLGRTARGEQSVSRTLWSAHPITLLQTFVPLFPQDLPLREDLRALLYEGREPLLSSLYLGLPALALALAAVSSTRRRLVGGAALLVAVSLLLALGRHGLAYFWATATLPALEILRYPVKATLLVAFGFALLVGAGLEVLQEGRISRRARDLLALLVGSAAVTVLLAARTTGSAADGLLAPSPEDPLVPGATDAVLALTMLSASTALVVAGLLALSGRARIPRRGAWGVTGMAALAVLELLVVHRGLNPSAPRSLAQAVPRVVEILREDGARRVYVFDYLLRLAGTEMLRPEWPPALAKLERSWRPLVQATGYPSSLPRWGLEGSYDMDVVGLDSPGRRGLRMLMVASARHPMQLLRLLRVGGVGHVVALHREGLDALVPLATVTHPVVGDVYVYRVPEPLPLVSAVPGVEVATGVDRYRTLVDPAFAPRTTVILSAGEARQAPDGFVGNVEVREFRPDGMRVRSATSHPALLLVPEGYDEDWTAEVDGATASVLRANLAFRAVPVPAGAHDVELAYRPRSVPRGLAVSALSILGALLGLGLRSRVAASARRSRSRDEEKT